MVKVAPLSPTELKRRLDHCIRDRLDEERRWAEADTLLYDLYSQYGLTMGASSTGQTIVGVSVPEADNSDSDVAIVYLFKNLRFIHAQLSTNPPVVSPRPTSSDAEDLRRADAADRLIRYGLRQYNMQEKFDIGSLYCLQYGTTAYKTHWDTEAGDFLEIAEDGNAIMEGDFELEPIHPKFLYIDPDAQIKDKIRFLFQKYMMSYEEALFKFPDKKDILETCRRKQGDQQINIKISGEFFDVVEIYEYWETGLPTNGYAGRHCFCTREGASLTECGPSPYAFSRPGKLKSNSPKKAKLPYHFFTDVDVPGRVWGRTFIDYAARPQEILNRLDSATLDAIQAHGVMRLAIPDSCELTDGSPSNSNWDAVKYTGNIPPSFIQPPSLPPDMSKYRELLKQGIDDLSGVNESMFGQQSRETAGFAMQYAVNQGSMIRRRLFNKYAMVTESVYKDYLNLLREKWETKRKISVLGKEKALEVMDIAGMDLDGGYDIFVEYGTSLSLDPITRRQEILQLQPLFEQAGVPKRTSLRLMRLNELSEMYDELDLAEDRQREYVQEMIATGEYVPPRPFEDHENMLLYLKKFVMQQEFKALPEKDKPMIYQHIVDRSRMKTVETQMLSPQTNPGAGAPPPEQVGGLPPAMPAPAMAGGMPPVGQ